MKLFKFLLIFSITILLVYSLNTRLVIQNTPIPPLGKFLDPAQGFWRNSEKDSLEYTKSINIEGLTDSVSVTYDKNGVPHIYAQNNHDLYMAQGFIIAQHRLWQMEFQTHAAAGRVSEIIGEGGLEFDRMQRRKGMTYGAEITYEAMKKDPLVNSCLEAYANGVNAYIQSLSYQQLPIEYKLLGYEPEEWTPMKSALILEYMIDALTGHDDDFENSNALNLFGLETFNFLFPEKLPGMVPVIPSGNDNPWDFQKVNATPPATDLPTDLIKNILPKPDPDNGSNNWAVSGNKTASGKPILCNDTHLGLNLPSLWFMIQLSSPEVNVYGFTFTGAAGVTIGFNDSIAWGFTNAPRDNKDWYKINFQNSSANKYKYDDQWIPTEKRIEAIKIRGAETYYDTVVYTRQGPVVYDKSFGDNDAKKNYALRWIGHDPSLVQKALLDLNKGKNYDDYLKAIENWDAPPQNIVFASTSGDIALRVQGQYVAKWPGQGKFLMDGNNPLHEWQHEIPKTQNPYQYNPERNFVSSANQLSVDSLYPYWVYNSSQEHYRNRMINRELNKMSQVTVEDMKKLQLNSYSLLPEETLPMFLDSIRLEELSKNEIKALQQLQEWDYNYKAESHAPTYFQAWWKLFMNCLWDEFSTKEVALTTPDEFTTTYIIKHFPDYKFIDVDSTDKKESLTDLINYAFKKSQDDLGEWQESTGLDANWGNYKGTYIKHLADLGGSLAGFSRYNIQVDGVADAINSTKRNHGPSQRFIVEMTSPPQAYVIYPGGQSGNPGSVLYDNMINNWRDREYLPVVFTSFRGRKSDQMIYSQQLNP
ncbi:penicillin acylase family protein [Fulvivirga maritima]|uniref:penicillin acylase family protein n=1 Tax=Fulvivirga maritima TaxID=2904247 RepID=UPI001F339B4E|nr:penicillin acylase family protein [Fulvivirga maritima]UII24827.1 penicillin acylase family protein [Fulvivirga maritima]